MRLKVGIVGGCGHVGLPLAVSLAAGGRDVKIYDINKDSVEKVNQGISPFNEPGLQLLLSSIRKDTLSTSTDPSILSNCDYVIYIVGTPLNAYLQPDFSQLEAALDSTVSYLNNNVVVLLRSTLYPGTTERVEQRLYNKVRGVLFTPERIAEGKAIEELHEHPQIVGTDSDELFKEVKQLFRPLTRQCIRLTALEAEFTKLFTNAHRYCEFALVNQLYTIAEKAGLDFYKIQNAMKFNYPRLEFMPNPGFAAGPCLLKDTLQLVSFSRQEFTLGQASFWINENMPDFIVDQLKKEFTLMATSVGILGLTFKPDVDDTRDSLACKLKNLLNEQCLAVRTYDPYLKNSNTLDEVLNLSEVIIIGAPHKQFSKIKFNKNTHVVDIWNKF